ncbi:MAG: low molecular weight phosphatase family protein [Microbacterium sp.]|uniref:arsenate reductase/protein-tyrosine-phosphatase family protein n=1 Tax=Microbacterium sp. TaxID=51671 RepID=UPI001AD25BD9|nr:low molecular weight phosphatase family protein [Microbacterium sp.]MBN9177771.1 low molecular weight phosphatase family protein [Microbacterium sp.]
MLDILTVCTGNICRSPLAAELLATRLADLGVTVSSAGTRARDGAPMTPEAQELAAARGIPASLSAEHAARYLTLAHIAGADLVLAMTRDHRREVVELDPSRVRTAFTVRELARLAADVSDEELRAAAGSGSSGSGSSGPGGADARERFAAALAVVAGRRGLVLPPASPEDDDVIDPYGRSMATYERSADEMAAGLAAAERIARIALS